MSRIRRSALAAAGGIALALLVVLPSVWAPARPPAPAATSPAPNWPYLNATASVGPVVAHHLASPFYAVVLTIVNRSTPVLAALGAYLNSTPITWFRVGGGGEAYDPTTDTDFVPPPGAGSYQPFPVQLWNLSWFRSFCDARAPHCQWLANLPAEENDSALALSWAEWYHATLGAPPTLWQFGNEPEGWTHYGRPLATWTTSDSSTVSPAAYATMVRSYIAAISAVYPADRYVGIEASCACDTGLIQATAAVDGSRLAAMAYHTYPAPTANAAAVGPFLGALAGSSNLPGTSQHFDALLSDACSGCAGLPVEVGEYQAGPFGDRSPLAAAYPGAVFLAASVAQALATNVSMLTVYDSGALYNMSTGTISPEGILYQRILANLTMGADASVSVAPTGMSGVYGIFVTNGTREALLVVNANTTTGDRLTVPAGLYSASAGGDVWSWDPSTTVPVRTAAATLAATYSIPPEGILLVANY